MGRGGGGRLFEAGRLLTFSAFGIGAYSKWALIRGWAPIRINTVIQGKYFVNHSIVYGSGGPTERISSFVDSLLQPIAQKQRVLLHQGHYAHFILNFGIENTPLSEAAILATLGPILFTFYVDDLINEISNSQAEMYVDDCQLFLKFKVSDSANANSAVNNDLIRMSTWCSHNSLLINPKKTKLLVAGLPQLTSQLRAISLTVTR